MIKTATKIVKKIQDSGFEAYFAGGFVRDLLLGNQGVDIDIATSACPEEIEKKFTHTIPIGKKFGIIQVLEDGHSFEVATFRNEGEYENNRRPKSVTFTDANNDALRRDFTINGMFYDPIRKKLLDFVGGEKDIKKKTIRFIGDPQERIDEDYLRIIRAIRFKVTLAFQYENRTFEALRKNAQKIPEVSAERIRSELDKIMQSPYRHIGLVELSESSILKYIIPEIEKLKGVPQPIEYHHEGDVFTHTYLALKSLGKGVPSYLAWAVMFHDIAKPQTLKTINSKIVFNGHAKESAKLARKIMERLKFPNFEKDVICYLIENHMRIGDIEKMRPAKKLEFLLDRRFSDLILLAQADAAGIFPQNQQLTNRMREMLKNAKKFKEQKIEFAKNKFFSGNDLVEAGFLPGDQYRIILEDISDKIIDGIIMSKQQALEYVLNNYSK